MQKYHFYSQLNLAQKGFQPSMRTASVNDPVKKLPEKIDP
jgi:hypothetical protein